MTLKITARRDEAYRPGETAILFVDMQKMFCTPGARPPSPRAGRQALLSPACSRAPSSPTSRSLIKAARASGVQVLHTIIEALTKDCRDCSLDHKLSNLMIPKGMPRRRADRRTRPHRQRDHAAEDLVGRLQLDQHRLCAEESRHPLSDRRRRRHRPVRRHGGARRRRPRLSRHLRRAMPAPPIPRPATTAR